jgi:hypothetical protein
VQNHSQIWPFAIAALAVLMIYRKLRRSFGRQVVRPVRMSVRIAILLILAASLVPSALKSAEILYTEIACAAAGITLALWGANRTRFERHAGQLYYVPHTYTGIAVTLLVLGRLVYRLVQIYSMDRLTVVGSSPDAAPGLAPPSLVQSPVTVGVFFVLIGYYVCYYGSVLLRSRHVRPEDIEEPTVRPLPAEDAPANAP